MNRVVLLAEYMPQSLMLLKHVLRLNQTENRPPVKVGTYTTRLTVISLLSTIADSNIFANN